MTLERRNPLPAGTYWLDVFGTNRSAFASWRVANQARLRVHATESFTSDPPRDWIKFEALQPVPWEATLFGYPTIIAPGAKVDSSSDTVQRPDPEPDLLDQLGPGIELGEATKLAAGAAGVVVGLGVLVLLVRLLPEKKG